MLTVSLYFAVGASARVVLAMPTLGVAAMTGVGQIAIWANVGPDGGWNWRVIGATPARGWARTWTEAQQEAIEARSSGTVGADGQLTPRGPSGA